MLEGVEELVPPWDRSAMHLIVLLRLAVLLHRGRSSTALPQLVRIDLERSDPALPAWPTLVAAPRATINTDCIFDPLTAGCRRVR